MTPAGMVALLDAVIELAQDVDVEHDDAWRLVGRIAVVRIELDRLQERIYSVNNTPQPKSPPAPPKPPPSQPKGGR